MNVNIVCLAGNLTRDPEVRTTNSDMSICSFGLAVNERRKEGDKAHFFDCKAFGKTAETIAKHFTKGKPIFLRGRLQLEQWEDKDGQKRSKVSVIAEEFQFVESKRDGAKRSESDDVPW